MGMLERGYVLPAGAPFEPAVRSEADRTTVGEPVGRATRTPSGPSPARPPALVAQRIEHRPPEPCAQVRVLPRAPNHPVGRTFFSSPPRTRTKGRSCRVSRRTSWTRACNSALRAGEAPLTSGYPRGRRRAGGPRSAARGNSSVFAARESGDEPDYATAYRVLFSAVAMRSPAQAARFIDAMLGSTSRLPSCSRKLHAPTQAWGTVNDRSPSLGQASASVPMPLFVRRARTSSSRSTSPSTSRSPAHYSRTARSSRWYRRDVGATMAKLIYASNVSARRLHRGRTRRLRLGCAERRRVCVHH